MSAVDEQARFRSALRQFAENPTWFTRTPDYKWFHTRLKGTPTRIVKDQSWRLDYPYTADEAFQVVLFRLFDNGCALAVAAADRAGNPYKYIGQSCFQHVAKESGRTTVTDDSTTIDGDASTTKSVRVYLTSLDGHDEHIHPDGNPHGFFERAEAHITRVLADYTPPALRPAVADTITWLLHCPPRGGASHRRFDYIDPGTLPTPLTGAHFDALVNIIFGSRHDPTGTSLLHAFRTADKEPGEPGEPVAASVPSSALGRALCTYQQRISTPIRTVA